MANDDKFFSQLIREIGLHLFVAAPARVLKVYPDYTADIKPLFKTQDEQGNIEEHSPVLLAPVLQHVGTLLPGDVVWVNFADRSLDNMNRGQTFDPGFTRIHSMNDAVVVGRFKT